MSYSRKPLNLKEVKIKQKKHEQLESGAFGYTLFSDTGL